MVPCPRYQRPHGRAIKYQPFGLTSPTRSQRRMARGVVDYRLHIALETRTNDSVRLEQSGGLSRVVGLLQEEIGNGGMW